MGLQASFQEDRADENLELDKELLEYRDLGATLVEDQVVLDQDPDPTLVEDQDMACILEGDLDQSLDQIPGLELMTQESLGTPAPDQDQT